MIRRRPFTSVFLLLLIALLGWTWHERVNLQTFPTSLRRTRPKSIARVAMSRTIPLSIAGGT